MNKKARGEFVKKEIQAAGKAVGTAAPKAIGKAVETIKKKKDKVDFSNKADAVQGSQLISREERK